MPSASDVGARDALPHRADAGAPLPAALVGLPLPPGPMPAVLGGRPLKRWRYVAVFDERLMLCAAVVRIAGLRTAFWAVWDRERRVLHGRTRPGRGLVDLAAPDRLSVRDGGSAIELVLEHGHGVATVTRHGVQHAWTAKTPLAVHGTVRLPGGRRTELRARGLRDDTAAYYARRTAWWWSAGVGESADGRPAAWNLVAGVGDPPVGSERTVWLDGVPAEAGTARFAPDLSRVRTADGGDLRFAAEAARERRERFVVLSSAYRQPFGTVTGTLPGGVALARGLGVMERHVARW